jgi:hypothetical protein
MLRITDPTNFRRSAAGLCLLAGPLLIFAGDLVSPTTPDGTREYLAFVAEHETAGIVSTLLFFGGLLLLVPGVLGSLAPIRRRGVVFAHLAAIVATVGLVAFAGLVTTSFYEIELAQSPSRDAAVAVYEGVEDSPLVAFFAVGFLGTAVGLVLFAAAWLRAGLAPPWIPVLVLAGFVTIVAASNDVLGLVGNGLLAVALGTVAVKVLRTPDETWGSPAAGPATGAPGAVSSREAIA